ncbi:MAG: cardiolipin synthase [Desulfobacteraceae bacterium]|nr:MAG: cardiolipin synthase [Desulfobacteraceae bacterium]
MNNRVPGISKSRFLILVLISSLCLLPLLGCRFLPSLHEVAESGSIEESPPSVSGPFGPLSMKESKALIDQVKEEAGPTDLLTRHVSFVEELSGQPLIAGNRVTLLSDGPETFAAMSEAIHNAKEHINLETFIIRDDEVGRPLADLLIRKRREGVLVNIIYDSFGAKKTPSEFFERMKANGLNVVEFNPVGFFDLLSWGQANNRDHRKILVVDGKVAFTGGINFYRVYSKSSSSVLRGEKDPQSRYYWRDTHVQVEGPAVAEFQRLFLETWRSQNGPDIAGGEYFPSLKKEGDSLVRVIASSPDQSISNIYAAYVSAMAHAERSVHLTHAYLVLDPGLRKAITDAAKRGVSVKIILPAFSDFWMPFHAARANYSELLAAGVRLFERQNALLHSKTAVIDGVWSTVGSSNLDVRSFLHDTEVNAVVLGTQFGGKMERMFEYDLSRSKEITPGEWEKRPVTDRIKERTARLFRYWL